MVHATLKLPAGNTLEIDAPNGEMLGQWLMAVFSEFSFPKNSARIPTQFTLTVE